MDDLGDLKLSQHDIESSHSEENIKVADKTLKDPSKPTTAMNSTNKSLKFSLNMDKVAQGPIMLEDSG